MPPRRSAGRAPPGRGSGGRAEPETINDGVPVELSLTASLSPGPQEIDSSVTTKINVELAGMGPLVVLP